MSAALIPAKNYPQKTQWRRAHPRRNQIYCRRGCNGGIPDYQLSAFLMAVYWKSMSAQETTWLTQSMKNSGKSYDWKKLNPKLANFPLVDKHSTGGVGDKVSLILVPLAIELGLRVPMMSGRGLGHTGGTVDKLLSIPGFKMDLDEAEASKVLSKVGAVMLSQTKDLCPADKKFYHLRDVTATVESYPLIAASILSKKWAEGCEGIIFDVKFGEGAFMETPEKANELAHWLLRVSHLAGLKAEAILSRMEEPLGTCIGNALEVKESIWILKNEYPSEKHKDIARALKKLCCQIAARMALIGGTRKNFEECVLECEKYLNSGKAFKRFDDLVRAQGAIENWEAELPTYKTFEVKAPCDGFVSDIKARELGILGLEVGIGRKKMEDTIDEAAGFELLVTLGCEVKKGEALALLHLKKDNEELKKSFLDCLVIEGKTSGATTRALLWKILEQPLQRQSAILD
ncbi:MAG: thymidine phosphorylase [Bdellovibrionota bacterium]